MLHPGHRLLFPAILAFGVLVTYRSSLDVPFVFDDFQGVVHNPNVQDLSSPLKIFQDPEGGSLTGSRPLAALTLAVDYALYGRDVRGYHVVNIAVHLAAALALFGLVRRTLELPHFTSGAGRDAGGTAFAIALLWALHPLPSECATYITSRTESLMGLFYLLTLYCFVRAGASPQARGRWRKAAVACCLLSMASKEVAVSLPLAVLLYDRLLVGRAWRDIWRTDRPFYAALGATWAALLGFVLLSLEQRLKFIGIDVMGLSWDRYALTQAGILLHYLRLCVIPFPLSIDYSDWRVVEAVTDVLPQLLAVGTLLVGTVLCWHRAPALFFLGACFFMILAPTSSVLVLKTELATERRMYLPCAVIMTLLVSGVRQAFDRAFPGASRRRTRLLQEGGVLAALSLCFIVLTVRRNAEYWDDALWRETIRDRPRNARAHNNMGTALQRGGIVEQAFRHVEKAVAADPTSYVMHGNLGLLHEMRGMDAKARHHYEEALRLAPNEAAAPCEKLGTLLARLGHAHEAAGLYREALRRSPRFPEARYRLAWILSTDPDPALRNGPEALRLLNEGVWIDADRMFYLEARGAALAETGRFTEAVEAAREAEGLALAAGKKKRAAAIRACRTLYERGEPCRSGTR